MRRAIIAFFPAVLGAYLLGSVISTQIILARVEGMGLAVLFRDRLQATGHDLLGLASSYLPLMLLAFLVALPVAGGLARLAPRLRPALYPLAGFLAVLALHLIMKAVLGLNGVASVRETHGLLLQGFAGAFGGYLFYLFRGAVQR